MGKTEEASPKKVYCSECRWESVPPWYHFTPTMCRAGAVKKKDEYDTPFRHVRVSYWHRAECRIKNRNNDCPDYQPKLWLRIRNRLGGRG